MLHSGITVNIGFHRTTITDIISQQILYTLWRMQGGMPNEDQYTKGAGIYKMGKHALPSIITNQIAVYWWRVHPLTYIVLLHGSRNYVA